MKHLKFGFAILIALPLFGFSQKQDTASIVLPTDIYNNFKKDKIRNDFYLVLKTEEGKVLFERTLKSSFCAECYEELTNRADSFYNNSQFNEAVLLYSAAFKLNNDKGKIKHRLNAACSWTKLGDKEKAFNELTRVTTTGKFTNYSFLQSNSCFKPLNSDPRWNEVLATTKQNLYESGARLPSDIKN